MLPVQGLHWDAFELLCCELLSREYNQITSELYGLPGQNQRGIDVLGYDPDRDSHVVIQCKRYQSEFGPSHLVKAVDRFLEGEWNGQAYKLIVAVTRDVSERSFADERMRQRERLVAKDFEFDVWGEQHLSTKLREHPDLVERYFGPHWLRAFVGVPSEPDVYLILDATSVLNGRLPNHDRAGFADAVRQRGHRPADNIANLDIGHPEGFEPEHWDAALQRMKESLGVWRALKSANPMLSGTAVFPLAKVSLLFALGLELGDTNNIELFRYERARDTWRWDEREPVESKYHIVPPERLCKSGHVALFVSTSRSVDRESALEAIRRSVGVLVDVDIWELREPDGINMVHHADQLDSFRRSFQKLSDAIYEVHRDRIDMHVFSCAAAPFVVAMGQSFLDGRPRAIHLYEYERGGRHHRVLTL